MKKNYLIWIAIIFAVIYLFTTRQVNQDEYKQEKVALVTSSNEITQGKTVKLTLHNNSDRDLQIENECPEEYFRVFRYKNGEWNQLSSVSDVVKCDDEKLLTVKLGEKMDFDYAYWKYDLFNELGRYQIRADIIDKDGNKKEYFSNEFSIVEPSMIVVLWRQILYRPFYNLLIALTIYLPYHSLGLAIIVLTLIIRLVLLLPSQKGMKAQKRMQDIQPKLQHIKEKYKGDQQRIAQETMKIWRENKVNPMGSCLPLLIQFPVLIALFYVVQEGLDPNNIYLLYEPFKNFDLKLIASNFLGILDLTKVNVIVLPLIVGGLQFVQMKLSMSNKKNPQEKKSKKKSSEPDLAAVNNIMIYVMPVMIAVFTASLPAGVGLYWAVSTIFGIGQQIVVNKQPMDSGKSATGGDGDVTVKVLN